MPIYEYACESCNHQLEALQGFSDQPLVECPSCGEPRLRKLISAVAFRLKGGGWYETDFKDKNKRNIAGESDASGKSESGGGKSEGKSESKSEGGKGEAKTEKTTKPSPEKPAKKAAEG